MSSQLRGLRDRGTGARREGDRLRQGRGNSKDYFEDLGFSTTKENAERVRSDNQKLAEHGSLIGESRANYDSARSEITKAGKGLELDSILSQEWKKFEPSLITVRAVDAENNIIGTYRVPESGAKQFEGQKGIWATYVDDGKFYNISAKDLKSVEEIDKVLAEMEQVTKETFYAEVATSVAPQIAEAKGMLSEASATLESNAQGLYAAETEYASITAIREMELQDVLTQQAERIATMQAIFNEFHVGGGS